MFDNCPDITVITGGIGGAKLVEGLAAVVPTPHLTVIGNTGDDDQFHGLWVSPDVDILTYTLAGEVDRNKGWGLKEDSFGALGVLKRLGQEVWMQLGDKDLAVHIYRTMRRCQGEKASVIAAEIAASFGVKTKLILPTDDELQTKINTPLGVLSMEEYFVREQCKPEIHGVIYDGCGQAKATLQALRAIADADIVIFAPSNPVASIGPALSIPDIRSAIENATGYRVVVSPIIAGKAVKGPSCEMLTACGFAADVFGVYDFYSGLIDAMVIDERDSEKVLRLEELGIDVICQNTLMEGHQSRVEVARYLLQTLLTGSGGAGR